MNYPHVEKFLKQEIRNLGNCIKSLEHDKGLEGQNKKWLQEQLDACRIIIDEYEQALIKLSA